MLVRHLGSKPYAEVMALQSELVQRRAARQAPDTLLLAQHPSLYTRGAASRRRPAYRLPYPLRTVNREGGLFFYGPGQLAGYPVFDLRGRGLTLDSYERSLEGVLIEALLDIGVKAIRHRGEAGLCAAGKRLVFIGVAVESGISNHGFAINVDCDLAPLRLITPQRGLEWTSLQELLGHPPDEISVARSVAEAFLRYF